MKKLFSILAFMAVGVLTFAGVEVGDVAPEFSLKNIDGKMVGLSDYKDVKGVIVIFTCNHCPYAVLYEDRIVALNNKLKGLGFPVVAINPNDVKKEPGDSYDEMVKRAKEKGFTFPYLHDESQAIAKAYGATRTPHVYLLTRGNNGKFSVAYIGAIDNDTENVNADTRTNYVENAVKAFTSGKKPDPATTKAIGCTIKWK
jgi:peroxiredoxin